MTPDDDREWKKGSAELLILSLVEDQSRHGYEIAKLIEMRSAGTLRFGAASLYPLLYRLEEQGVIEGRWVEKADSTPATVLPAHAPWSTKSAGSNRAGRPSWPPSEALRELTMPEWTTLIRLRLFQLSTKSPPDADIIEELAAHLQDRYRELIASGADEPAAIDAALDELAEEDLRAFALGRRRLHVRKRMSVQQEPRRAGDGSLTGGGHGGDGARVLSRNPGFATVVILTLAFGIAANTTAFTVINSILMTPLPVNRSSELVELYTRGTKDAENADEHMPISYLNLRDIAANSNALQGTLVRDRT